MGEGRGKEERKRGEGGGKGKGGREEKYSERGGRKEGKERELRIPGTCVQ